MKSIKLSVLIDTFFIFTASLFFFYAVILYSGHGFLLSTLLGVILAIIISILYLIIISLKGDIITEKESLEVNVKSFNYTLLLLSENEILNLLKNYYEQKNIESSISKSNLIIDSVKAQIFPIIKIEKITLSEILQKYKRTKKGYKTIIFGIDFEETALSFLSEMSLRVEIIKTSDAYTSLSSKNLLPTLIKIDKKVNKLKLRYLSNQIFSKKNAKRFLITGVFFIILSFFTFYPVYYIIFGTALMIIGVTLRLYGKKETEKIIGLDKLTK